MVSQDFFEKIGGRMRFFILLIYFFNVQKTCFDMEKIGSKIHVFVRKLENVLISLISMKNHCPNKVMIK